MSLLRGWNWSSLYTAISFKLYLAESAKSALLCCHFITHSLAARAHVAPGSWSTAVSLLHQQRSFFSTHTEIRGEVQEIFSHWRTSKKWGQHCVTECERVDEPWCSSFQKYSPNIAAKCVTTLSTSQSCLTDIVRLTFRNDISRSMPSVSNLKGVGGGEREREREREQERGRSEEEGWRTDAGECKEGNTVNYSTGFPYRKWHRAHTPS